MLLAIALILLVFICVVVIITWYRLADGDLSLLYVERYGRKPADVFAGRVVWIVGCASGIGEELAYTLIRCGSRLALSDKNADDLQKVYRNCLEMGNVSTEDLLALPFDVTDFKNHEKYVDEVINFFGKIEVVFHNAGCSQRASFHDVNTEVDHDLFDINCLGHVNLARPIVRHFVSRGGGHFVATSSAFGLFGFPNGSAYCGSKYALRGFFEAIRAEYMTKGIKVTTVFPGAIFSNIFKNLFTTSRGKFSNLEMRTTDHRMKTSRCVELMSVAVANDLEEAWIAMKPFLQLMYLAQYAPVIFKRYIIQQFMVPEKADKLRDGRLF